MPDRVILPRGMPREYGSILIQLCEQQPPPSVASSGVVCLGKDWRRNGKGGNQLLTLACRHFEPLIEDSLLRQMTNWTDEYDQIDALAMEVGGVPLHIECAQRACHQVLQKVEDGEEIGDLKLALKSQSLINLWQTQVEENIPLSGPFPADSTYEFIREQLYHLHPYVEQEIERHLNGHKPPKIKDIRWRHYAGCFLLGGNMVPVDYTYSFAGFSDHYEPLQVFYHHADRTYQLDVRVDDSDLMYRNVTAIPSVLVDLVDLAAAIYVADWLSPRKSSKAHYGIRIVLPVRNPGLLNQPAVLTELSRLLKWYTGDQWQFEFHLRQQAARLIERKPKLISFDDPTEVALWSGGADSLAGLLDRMGSDTAPSYTLFGSGSNTHIQGKQNETAISVQESCHQRIKLIQLPIQCRYPTEHPPTNDLFRARGLVFKLLGAVCACLEGQDTLYIYENGYGALNLRFRLSQGRFDHTRAVHPLSLLNTAEFVSGLLNSSFRYENPYLFSTKAEMCAAIPEHASLAYSTVTCDGRYRQSGQPSQCGYCSSCLLRRMAFLIAFGEDCTEYLVTHGTISPKPQYRNYFEAMHRQAQDLREVLSSSLAWQELGKRHPSLRNVARRLAAEQGRDATVIQDQLLQMYQNHITEWQLTEATLQTSLINQRRDAIRSLNVPTRRRWWTKTSWM